MGAIDVHAHGFPEEFLRRLAAIYPDQVQLGERDDVLIGRWRGSPLPAFDLDRRLEEMDRDNVDVEVLSVPVIYGTIDESTVGLCRNLNDFQAAVVEQAPTRFRSFIHLPVPDADACRAELQRWQDHPAVVGVMLGSNMGGIYPGEELLRSVWEAIADHDLPVLIHPIDPCGVNGPVMPPVLLWPNDTAIAATSIIYSGLLDHLPSIDIVLSHYGGPLAVMARRIDMACDIPGFPPGNGNDLLHRPSTYLTRFYVDTAQGFHLPAFEAARAVFGIERILYGSDHFLLKSTFRTLLNQFLETLELSLEERHAILRGNAQQLLRRVM